MIAMDRERRVDLRTQLLDGPQHFASAWSGDLEVVAAPEIHEAARAHIIATLASGDSALLCLTTEDAGNSRPYQAVTASESEVRDWCRRFAPVDVVIARPDLSAAVLVSVDEFILIGGDRDTVETALGQTVEDARAEFAAYADSMATASRHLPGIAAQYG